MQINSGAPLSIHRMLTINRSAGFLAPFKISYKAAISWLHLQRDFLGDQASGWITKKKSPIWSVIKTKPFGPLLGYLSIWGRMVKLTKYSIKQATLANDSVDLYIKNSFKKNYAMVAKIALKTNISPPRRYCSAFSAGHSASVHACHHASMGWCIHSTNWRNQGNFVQQKKIRKIGQCSCW